MDVRPDYLTGFEAAIAQEIRRRFALALRTRREPAILWARQQMLSVPARQVFHRPADLARFLVLKYRAHADRYGTMENAAELAIMPEIAATIWSNAAAEGRSLAHPRVTS